MIGAMTISRLHRIKNLGVFRDAKWGSDLSDFSRFNLIYGWNGSGKTTLSKLLSVLTEGRHPEFSGLEYEVMTTTRSWKHGDSCTEKIRVFNGDFVRANVEKVGGPNPIFILGEENKKLITEIENDEDDLNSRIAALDASHSTTTNLQSRRDRIFTDIARTISQNVSGESTRTYRKQNAESDFNALGPPVTLSEEQITIHNGTIVQKQLPVLDPLPDLSDVSVRLIAILRTTGDILATEITAVQIPRLTDNADLSEWVEIGISLHQEHQSVRCEFCENVIASDRLNALSNHFNLADSELKKRVEEELQRVDGILSEIRKLQMREVSNIYDEFQGEYSSCVASTTLSQGKLIAQVDRLRGRLVDKRARTTERLDLGTAVDGSHLVDSIQSLNLVIQKHNSKTQAFDNQKDAARNELKRHYLSEIVPDVASIDAELGLETSRRDAIESESDVERPVSMIELRSRITRNRASMTSSHRACSKLNDMLVRFLGRNEISFEVSGEGYTVKRDGVIAESLSEGEKTAIAFVYFIVHLSDQDFDLEEGIVVIDDPVSSLDSNSLFQAFAFLKESVQGAKQIFVFTHNFEFMNLVKNWFFKVKPRNVLGVPQVAMYMVKNKIDGGSRCAYIAPLDPLLANYHSEYHYLFSLLLNFKEDASLEQIYLFPNIGRKVLETFLAFKIPSDKNMDEKMSLLSFADAEKSVILRFVNEHSHSNQVDGALEFDLSLTNGGQKVVATLLALIEKVDPVHYETMVSMCA